MLQTIYLLGCILGFALPYSQLIPFAIDHGFDLKLFFEQLFVNHISSCFALDVIVSSLVFWVLVWVEGTRLKIDNLWVYVVANLTVGLSFGLPLFLLMRERKLTQKAISV
ncbi:MAG: DUF2834 domain-containing protein [Xenococcaceae cyanobacterium MO_188.B29]|nr:DUF2834 domain-containing protein [Xenococcaceae cyanobacterium MO_188.B29]